MGELSALCGAGRADVIAGKVLSAPRLLEYAAAEEEFARRYVRTMAEATRGLALHLQEKLLLAVKEDVKNAALGFGTAAFDAWALSLGGAVYLGYLSLRVEHPQVTVDEAERLLGSASGRDVADAVWELWGYRAGQGEDGGERKNQHAPPADARSTGGASSGSCAEREEAPGDTPA